MARCARHFSHAADIVERRASIEAAIAVRTFEKRPNRRRKPWTLDETAALIHWYKVVRFRPVFKRGEISRVLFDGYCFVLLILCCECCAGRVWRTILELGWDIFKDMQRSSTVRGSRKWPLNRATLCPTRRAPTGTHAPPPPTHTHHTTTTHLHTPTSPAASDCRRISRTGGA